MTGLRISQSPASLPASSITVGTTTVSGGTTTNILYDNAGTLGEYTVSGTGTVVALKTSPVFVTPTLGVSSGTSLALGGATIGTDALGVTGTSTLNFGTLGASSTTSGLSILGTWSDAGTTFKGALLVNVTQTAAASQSLLADFQVGGVTKISLSNTGRITSADNITSGGNVVANASSNFSWSGSRGIITSPAAASLQLGQGDVDTAPVAQTLRTQGTLAGGTSNVAGANWTFIASPGKGTGAGGSFIFQTTPAGSTGTVVGTPTTALTINSSQAAIFTGLVDLSANTAGQIKFPAAQNQSADVHTLDDYEEGTWTPALTFGGGSTGLTYSTQTGTYTKIGNRVFGNATIILTAKGSSTGNASIGGLPFTVSTSSVPATMFIDQFAAGITATPQGVLISGSTAITPYSVVTGSQSQLDNTAFTNSSTLSISFQYLTTA